MMDYLRIRNWDKWQSYRKDRGQPPWIKLHRELLRNPEWVLLTDAQRGQLVVIWLLAADRNGVIPASPKLIQKLGLMDEEPDIKLFIEHGFIERGVSAASPRRQDDRTESDTETEADTDIGKSIKKRIPKDFSISQRVREWAKEKGHNNLDVHYENFKLAAEAKGYQYVDWDKAFMGAIRSNWAKVEADAYDPLEVYV